MSECIHISFAIKPDCYNMMASCYGICHGCGCCTKKKPDRYINRIRYLEKELEDEMHFDRWDDDLELRAIQERNVKANIWFFNRRIGVNRRLLTKYMEEQDETEGKDCADAVAPDVSGRKGRGKHLTEEG